jgi:hypothetical protein
LERARRWPALTARNSNQLQDGALILPESMAGPDGALRFRLAEGTIIPSGR